jgi:hypothetical protein
MLIYDTKRSCQPPHMHACDSIVVPRWSLESSNVLSLLEDVVFIFVLDLRLTTHLLLILLNFRGRLLLLRSAPTLLGGDLGLVALCIDLGFALTGSCSLLSRSSIGRARKRNSSFDGVYLGLQSGLDLVDLLATSVDVAACGNRSIL